MRRGVVHHEPSPPLPVNDTSHPGAHGDLAVDPVDDDLSGLDGICYAHPAPLPVEPAYVPWLSSTLGVEGGPVEDNLAVAAPQNLGLELPHVLVLVVELPGWRQPLRNTLLPPLPDHVHLRVPVGEEPVEVRGHLDLDALLGGHLLHEVGREAVGIVEEDELLGAQPPPPQVPLDDRPPLLKCPAEPLFLQLHDLPYDGPHGGVHEVGEAVVHGEDRLPGLQGVPQGVQGPYQPPDQHPGEVADAGVGRNRPVVEHQGKGAGVVHDDEGRLHPLHEA